MENQTVVYLTVWRKTNGSKYLLIHKTKDISSKNNMVQRITLQEKQFVRKGDVIGIHYDQPSSLTVIPSITREDNPPSLADLYDIATASNYDHEFTFNKEFDFRAMLINKGQLSVRGILEGKT